MNDRTIIRGGHAVLPEGTRRCDVVIEAGVITQLPDTASAARGDRLIEADGLMVLPGLIDAHVHFQDPGRRDWEGWDHGSAAAAAGGVTTVVDMPIDSWPPTTTADLLRAKADAGQRRSIVDFGLWGGLTPNNLGRLADLGAAGAVGFKAFMCDTGWEDFPPVDDSSLDAGLSVARSLGLPVAVHAEDPELFDPTPGIPASAARPPGSEVAAVERACRLAARHQANVHFVHVSSASAAELAKGYARATVETCPHYLLLDDTSERVTSGRDARGTCCPPVRDAANQERLWELLGAGVIDWIASDHSPCLPAMKTGPSPWPGIAGVQTTLPALWASGRVELVDLVGYLTHAARLLRLPGKGELKVGGHGDVVLFDPFPRWTLQPTDLAMRHAELSPYLGMEMRGRVISTLVRGQVVFECGGTARSGGGTLISPAPSREAGRS